MQRLLALAAAAVVIVAVRPIAALAQAIGLRADYAFDLEWMEGAQLMHAERLLQGLPIYSPCDAGGFVPLPYPPLHFAVVAGAGAMTGGVDHSVGRAVSIVALLVALGILAHEAWLAAPTRWSREVFAVVAVATVAAGYPIVDGWYDLIRVDMLFATLVLVAAALTASCEEDVSARRAVAIGVLLTLAFFAKQTAAFYGPCLAIALLVRDRRACAIMLVTGAVLSLATLGALQLASDGWYWDATFRALGKHAVSRPLAWLRVKHLFLFMPWALLTLPLAAVAWRRGWLRFRSAVWLGVFVTAIPQALISAAKAAAHVNNLIMLVVLAGPVLLIVCGDAWRNVRETRVGRGAAIAAAALALWYGWSWTHTWPRYLPTPENRASAQRVVDTIASLDGDVIAPAHPFLPIQAGKSARQPISQTYLDYAVLDGFDIATCAERIDAEWAVLGAPPYPLWSGLTHRSYVVDRPLRSAPWTRSGYRTRPHLLLRRRVPTTRYRVRVLWDFESGTYDGWTASGTAFGDKPTGTQRYMIGAGGRYVASSLRRDNAAKGRLVSEPFVIDRDYMGLLVSGGGSGASVELEVNRRRVHLAIGRKSAVMIPYRWDVTRYAGKRARMIATDESAGDWGHIVVDDIVLFDLGTR